MTSSDRAETGAPEISVSRDDVARTIAKSSGAEGSAVDSRAPNDSKNRPIAATTRGARRLERRSERDLARGYSLNVKQVTLAFAVEFMIIGLVLTAQYFFAADSPNATLHAIGRALLFPIALSMIELARVPLAIAVRTQNGWTIKFAALVGVLAAVVVTTTSLTTIGYSTFDLRLQNAETKKARLDDARAEQKGYEAELAVKKKDQDDIQQAYNKLTANLATLQAQNCNVVTGTVVTNNLDAGTSQTQTQQKNDCRVNPALKPLQNEVAAMKARMTEAEAAYRQKQTEHVQFDQNVSAADAEYRTAVYQSQLHSYTAMLYRKDVPEVTAGEVKTLEGFLISIPSIAAALSSTLIAMTAVHRIRPRKEEAEVKLPDEAASYLFGPLVTAIRKEASEAVQAALARTSPASDQSAAADARSSSMPNAAAPSAAT